MANRKPKNRDTDGRFDCLDGFEQKVAHLRERRAARATMREVAAELGVSLGWVHMHCKESVRA